MNNHKNNLHQGDTKKAQMRSMLFAGQSFWYLLTIIIYLGCTLLGFGIAFLVTKLLVEMKVR